jgi:hypothetical protein
MFLARAGWLLVGGMGQAEKSHLVSRGLLITLTKPDVDCPLKHAIS